MASKLPKITIYVPPEVKERLERLAASEQRSTANMALVLVIEGLTRRESRESPDRSA